MAKAHKLPSGSWRVQVYAGKNAEGRRQYRSFTASTKRQAEYEALQWQIHYKEIARDASAMTLAEAMDQYLASKDGILSPSTLRGYANIRRKHLQGLMDIRLNRLTSALVQEVINEESKPYLDRHGKTRTPSPKLVRNVYGLLTAVLSQYHPDLQLRITLPQKQVVQQQVLEPNQIGKLFRAIRDTPMEIPVLLAVWLCMRSSEIAGLTWECVDFQRKTITIRQAMVYGQGNQWVEKTTKTAGSTRIINAPEYIMDKLAAAKETATSDHVVNLKGNQLYRRLKTILKHNDLPDIRFHDLRHTAASVMASLNIPNKYAQNRGGWSTPQTMQQVYTHVMESKRNIVDEQIDEFFYSLL